MTANAMGTAVTEIVGLAIENEALRKQVAELQAWKDAVPLNAVRTIANCMVTTITPSRVAFWRESWREIDAWLATIAPESVTPTQPEVQP